MDTIHGTCVLVSKTGVLLRGPSGAGKSDVALRLVDGGALLVADDRVVLGMNGDGVMASPPALLAGLLEVRGIGILPVPHVARARLGLVVDMVAAAAVERLPDASYVTLLGKDIPRLAFDPTEPATPAKIRLAVHALESGQSGSSALTPAEGP